MNLWEFEGKNVRLVDATGQIWEGKVGDYIWPDDNEPEGIEGIILNRPIKNEMCKIDHLVQFNAPEIKSIEIIP